MKTKILYFLLYLMAFMFVVPATSMANTAVEIIEQEIPTISVSVYGSVLRVEGANDEMLYIYNVTGVRVMSVKVDGNDKRYNLNLSKGCYIVKVGNIVRKINIR